MVPRPTTTVAAPVRGIPRGAGRWALSAADRTMPTQSCSTTTATSAAIPVSHRAHATPATSSTAAPTRTPADHGSARSRDQAPSAFATTTTRPAHPRATPDCDATNAGLATIIAASARNSPSAQSRRGRPVACSSGVVNATRPRAVPTTASASTTATTQPVQLSRHTASQVPSTSCSPTERPEPITSPVAACRPPAGRPATNATASVSTPTATATVTSPTTSSGNPDSAWTTTRSTASTVAPSSSVRASGVPDVRPTTRRITAATSPAPA